MNISEIMHKNPVCVTTTETLTNIAKEMKKGDFGAVIVKETDKPIGVVTDRDIVTRGLATNADLTKVTAQQVMTKKIFTCKLNDTLQTAADKMKSEKVRRLVVLDDQSKIVGILSLGDLARVEKGKETGPVFEALEAISKH